MASSVEESASFNRGKAATIEDDDCYVFIYDRRSGDKPEVKVSTGGMFEFSAFKQNICDVSMPACFAFLTNPPIFGLWIGNKKIRTCFCHAWEGFVYYIGKFKMY